MGAIKLEDEYQCPTPDSPRQSEGQEQYGFTIVVMNKYTGEIIETRKYKQVLITLEERIDLDEN